MAGNSPLKNVMEGDDVERFFNRFVMSEAERAQKMAAEPQGGWEHFPTSTAQVLQDVKEIWKKEGFLTPAETAAALMDKYLPNANGWVKDFLREAELSRDAPEQTTGYLGKEHAYTATGLAHLYALETGKPIAMIEADFSNMGGTNDYFKAKLAQERGPEPDTIPPEEYMGLTDQAMRVLCTSLKDTLKTSLPAGAKIVPIRTGGDELRLIVTGVNDPEQMRHITARMHMEAEKHVAAMGLQDHPHLKAPDDKVRNGFGVAVVMQDMAAIENPQTIIQELDADIKVSKTELGLLRLGRIDRDVAKAEIEQQLESGANYIPEDKARGQFMREEIAKREAEARKAANFLHSLNPNYNGALDATVEGFKAYAEKNMGRSAGGELAGFNLNNIVNADTDEPMASIHERRMILLERAWGEMNIWPSDAERRIVEMAVRDLSAIDPSAQVMMPSVLAPTIAVYAKDADAYRAKYDAADPAVQKALEKAGMDIKDVGVTYGMVVSYHNLGGLNNLLGHHNSDIVLRHMAKIIDQCLQDQGIPGGADKPYVIAHNGGACFTVVTKPGVTQADGSPLFISETMLQRAEKEIKKQVALFNKSDIAEFLANNGVEADDKLKAYLAKNNASTFADIKDPKTRKTDIDGQEVKGRVDGIHVGSVVAAFSEQQRLDPQRALDILKQHCDGRVDSLRRVSIMRDFLSDVINTLFTQAPESVEQVGRLYGAEQGRHKQQVMDAFKGIPASPDGAQMPPEVQALSVFKHKVQEMQKKMNGLGTSDPDMRERTKLELAIDRTMHRFEKQYDDLAQGGGLKEVVKFMQKQAAMEIKAQPENRAAITAVTKFVPKPAGMG